MIQELRVGVLKRVDDVVFQMYLSVLKRVEDCSFVQPSLVAGPLTAKVHERA